MKQLRDYLHLYLGCECFVPYDAKDCPSKIVGCESESVFVWNEEGRKVINIRNIKPILRPLSDMTDEESEYIGFDAYQILRRANRLPAYHESKVWAAEQTRYLLSKHFDLFGLIEAGLAIDATTLKQPA